MGVSLSRPFASCSHVEDGLDSIILQSINFLNDEIKTPKENMTVEAPMSCKRKDMEMDDPSKHVAAVKLQKVYKSFRTRRKLADCAVLIEQSWWKLLDYAALKRSSVSFFDIEKHETAISRWSRARTRAAKVGKGLSRDAKARKLSLLHWLEAIDPRHRYGHNLHFYYDKWLESQSREPFFYWLDIGEGKEINLEKCPRAKLQQQCVKYLGPIERLPYEVVVEDGRLFFKQSGELLHTTGESRAKWIFVLGTSKTLYVGKKKKGSFQHSSFLAGGATSCAGRLVVEHGVLKAVWPHSGHYRPTQENFKEFITFLQENNVDLSNVKMAPVEEDLSRSTSGLEDEEGTKDDSAPQARRLKNLKTELSKLEIAEQKNSEGYQMDSPTNDQEKPQEFASELDDKIITDEKHVPKVGILKWIISSKEMKSYQLGKQLSSKWTTGAGPRIGCVRNHPCELQCHVLEHLKLCHK